MYESKRYVTLFSLVTLFTLLVSFGYSGKTIGSNLKQLEKEYKVAKLYLESETPKIEELKEAIKIFRKIVKDHPESEIAADAQYSLGHSYRIQATRLHRPQENYTQAIKEYQKFIVDYPNHEKIVRAYMLMGFCHKELLNFGLAKEMYQKVIKDYPTSKEVKLAQRELADLNNVEHLIDFVKYKMLIETPRK